MTRTALIMPTINVPPNLVEWSAQLNDDDLIVIAGSGKTPHDDVRALLGKLPQETVYLEPGDERGERWSVSAYLPLNDHNRVNLALLEALTHSPDQVLMLDDDNYPADSAWVQRATDILRRPNRTMPVVEAESGWFNPGRVCFPQVVHRGYPLSHRDAERGLPEFRLNPASGERIGVFASLWLGDPDIDATERVVGDPQVREVRQTLTLQRGTWGPFDTQSTLVHAELAPFMFMWTDVGRFDDIWASYLCRAYMDTNDWHHAFGKPAVRQDRNPHNVVRDLRNELFGYEYTEPVTDLLRSLVADGTLRGEPFYALQEAVYHISHELTFLPRMLHAALEAWTTDIAAIKSGGMKWEN